MSDLVKLAKEAIKHYLETGKYLKEYDESLKSNNNGVIVIVHKDGRHEKSGSIYPTRSDIGLDVIHEAVNVAVFNNAIDLSDIEIDNLYISVYEVTKIKQIQYMEEFGMYHGLFLKYNNNHALVFRDDYESDYQMFEDAIKIANVDSHDVFTIEKFKVHKHL